MIKPEPCRVKVDGCDTGGREVAGQNCSGFNS